MCDIWLGNSFLDVTPKAWPQKENIDKTSLKVKLCSSKKNIYILVGQRRDSCTVWEKIFERHIYDKGFFFSRMHNKLSNSIGKEDIPK